MAFTGHAAGFEYLIITQLLDRKLVRHNEQDYPFFITNQDVQICVMIERISEPQS